MFQSGYHKARSQHTGRKTTWTWWTSSGPTTSITHTMQCCAVSCLLPHRAP